MQSNTRFVFFVVVDTFPFSYRGLTEISACCEVGLAIAVDDRVADVNPRKDDTPFWLSP